MVPEMILTTLTGNINAILMLWPVVETKFIDSTSVWDEKDAMIATKPADCLRSHDLRVNCWHVGTLEGDISAVGVSCIRGASHLIHDNGTTRRPNMAFHTKVFRSRA